MNHNEAIEAVGAGDTRVALNYHLGEGVRAFGRVVAYSADPQICIETESGERIWWRAELAEVVG